VQAAARGPPERPAAVLDDQNCMDAVGQEGRWPCSIGASSAMTMAPGRIEIANRGVEAIAAGRRQQDGRRVARGRGKRIRR
jgi:hypothetical protein